MLCFISFWEWCIPRWVLDWKEINACVLNVGRFHLPKVNYDHEYERPYSDIITYLENKLEIQISFDIRTTRQILENCSCPETRLPMLRSGQITTHFKDFTFTFFIRTSEYDHGAPIIQESMAGGGPLPLYLPRYQGPASFSRSTTKSIGPVHRPLIIPSWRFLDSATYYSLPVHMELFALLFPLGWNHRTAHWVAGMIFRPIHLSIRKQSSGNKPGCHDTKGSVRDLGQPPGHWILDKVEYSHALLSTWIHATDRFPDKGGCNPSQGLTSQKQFQDDVLIMFSFLVSVIPEWTFIRPSLNHTRKCLGLFLFLLSTCQMVPV